ncbi:hypothetical protein NDU88_004945 [Pleurodeles waltl]|uniref:Uncharacterized protein n=1 Tax=Pleurodeles waltl TaxID=8319 RepID=A0AAV7WXA0_PLEWA|nr:hypothetical protein NDU88_004945 [Pleurodeles waltl]
MTHTTQEEKEIGRDTALSPTVGIRKQADPGGEHSAGPERPREDQQRNEERGEESPREQMKNSRKRTLQSSPATCQEQHGSTRYGLIGRRVGQQPKGI